MTQMAVLGVTNVKDTAQATARAQARSYRSPREITEVRHALSNHVLLRQGVGAIQTKLVVGAPDDQYEQEADRVADAVMRMPEPVVQRQTEDGEEEEGELGTVQMKPVAEQISPLVRRQVEEEIPGEEEEVPIQTKSSDKRIHVTSGIGTQIEALRGGGQPLPIPMRTFFEPRMGYDFSQVRLHHDGRAAEAAQALHARAFTIGRDIVFGSGQYTPETSSGKSLLLHELTHVLQQSNLPPRVQRQPVTKGAETLSTQGTDRPGEVPEIDQMKAVLQVAFRVWIPQSSNADLIAEARRLNDKLFQPKSEIGPWEKSAIAETLIQMYQEMNHRIQNEAARQLKHPPQLTGLKWRVNDPLAGMVEGISPFHMIDWWGYFLQPAVNKKQRSTKQVGPSRSVVHRTVSSGMTAPSAQVGTSQKGISQGAPQHRAPIGTRKILSEAMGKPRKLGPDPEKWWRNLGLGPWGAVKKMAMNWINAAAAGEQTSARRFTRIVVASAMASMATKITEDAIREIKDPDTGLRVFVYASIPDPDERSYVPALQESLKGKLLEFPNDKRSLQTGLEQGKQIARKVLNLLDEKISGGGVRYLLYLKQKFRGDIDAIRTEVFRELMP